MVLADLLTQQTPVVVIPATVLMIALFAWGMFMLAAGAALCMLLRDQRVVEIDRDPPVYRPGRIPSPSAAGATTVVLAPRQRVSDEYDVYVGTAGIHQVPTMALTVVPQQRRNR